MTRHKADVIRYFDTQYLEYLYQQIRIPPRGTYWSLMQQMYLKEFVWTVANDDNRVSDGLDIRHEFVANASDLKVGSDASLNRPCSFLEVLIGLSRRLDFVAGGGCDSWAWQLVENLGLNRMTDPGSPSQTDAVDEILDRVIWRNYQPDGYGGFFPLAFPSVNQRRVELWYQMSAYIDEIPEL